MTINVNDILRVVLQFTMPGSTVSELVWHYLVTAGSGGADQDVIDDIVTAADLAFDNIVARMNNGIAGATADLFRWDSGLNRWDGLATGDATVIVATGANDMLPHGVAALVKFFTLVGRRQGRKFIPGFIETSQTGGEIVGAAVTDLVNFALDFHDDVVSAPVTLSPGNFNVDAASPLFETFAEWGGTIQIATTMAYQRRRKPGVGI